MVAPMDGIGDASDMGKPQPGGNGDDGRHEWWQSGVIYQVYPWSFADGNGDGVGDLRGIRSRLDYIQGLGVDCIWLSPIYPSPMADFGYDVSDYCDVHPLFGTLADFDALLADVHGRGMKLILDFVPNHTSDEHPWFTEARSSRDNPKRDWYIWRDPAPGGGPPNNWLSNFGGPAWRLDPTTGQYYFHAFLAKQPDLNWRNPELRKAMHGVLRFWLDRGVDGFRVDVIYHIVKDDQFRDNPRNPNYKPGQNPHHEFLATYITDRPEVHDVIAEMRDVVDAYPDRMLVGEVYLPVERLVTYYGSRGEGVHMPFNFQLITMPWNARQIAESVNKYEAALPPFGWPNWVLGNHDNPRVASRAGRDQAAVAAMLLLTLRGTPTLYYGDEIGMADVPIPPGRVQDPFERQVPGMGLGRDPERTPMQWDDTDHAGFSPVEPWLPVGDDYPGRNVATQIGDPRSLLSLYVRLIAIRRAEAALNVGRYDAVYSDEHTFAYLRSAGGRRFLVALNLTGEPRTIPATPTTAEPAAGRLVLSTKLDREDERVTGEIALRANEGILVEWHEPS
jgi:alpha-glucosidase